MVVMPWRVELRSQQVSILNNSLRKTDAVGQRCNATFTVQDKDGTGFYPKGTPVKIYDQDGNLAFAGVVNKATWKQRGRLNSGLFHSVDCVGWEYLATNRIIAESYQDKNAGYIVGDLITKYLAAEGITAGVIDEGPTVHSTVFNYEYLSKVFDTLVDLAGFVWYLDGDKKLHFHALGTRPAPFDADNTTVRYGSEEVSYGNDQYRNRQYIRGGVNLTDPQTETRVGDGNTKAWSMMYALAKVPTITADGVPKTVGIQGIDQGKDFYWSKGDFVISHDPQALPLAGGVQIQFQYIGQYNIVVVSEDNAAIEDMKTIEGFNGSGYVEDIVDAKDSADSLSSFQTATSLLAKYAKLGYSLTYQTRKSGLISGMVQNVNLPTLKLNNVQMLIQNVTARDDGDTIWYEVQAVECAVDDAWLALADNLAKPKYYVDSATTGEQQQVVVMAPVTESWLWTEQTSETVFACPIPSDNLYPADNLYPC